MLKLGVRNLQGGENQRTCTQVQRPQEDAGAICATRTRLLCSASSTRSSRPQLERHVRLIDRLISCPPAPALHRNRVSLPPLSLQTAPPGSVLPAWRDKATYQRGAAGGRLSRHRPDR